MMTNPRVERTRDLVAWWTFDRLTTLLTFLAIAAAALLMPAQNDTWWHLRAGHDIWLDGRVLLRDAFSFTVNGQFWPNHEWLSQVLFYALYFAGGLPLLTMGCATAVIGAWGIIWRLTQGPPRLKCLLVISILGSATTTWTLRPQALSLLFVAATVALLSRRRYGWLPPLFLVWANLHGAVLTGMLLLAAALAVAPFEQRRSFPRLGIAAALCALATLATPLGFRFWTEIPAFFIRVRLVHIDEFTAPRLTAPLWIPFWIAGAALAGLLAARAREMRRDAEGCDRGDITMCACALALLATAVTAARNTGPFLMVAVPALAVLVPPSWHRTTPKQQEYPRLNCATAVLAVVLACGVVVYAYANAIGHLRWTPLPDKSFAALNGCRGNLYNRFDEGGYLIWFVPGRPVFIDSRYFPYPDSLLQEHVRMEATGDSADTFRRYDIHCAYLPAQSLVGRRLMEKGWTSLYQDDQWAVLADAAAAVAGNARGELVEPRAVGRSPFDRLRMSGITPNAPASTPTAFGPSSFSSRAVR
jgi:hypothetical protein